MENKCILCPALKIHISNKMKLALDVIGGFHVEYRGFIEVKVLYFN